MLLCCRVRTPIGRTDLRPQHAQPLPITTPAPSPFSLPAPPSFRSCTHHLHSLPVFFSTLFLYAPRNQLVRFSLYNVDHILIRFLTCTAFVSYCVCHVRPLWHPASAVGSLMKRSLLSLCGAEVDDGRSCNLNEVCPLEGLERELARNSARRIG
ncbi:hypothetical protein F5879DRAFT_996834 [Lentinula edodes]|nr:hypothetical protein F5879DRAFT_996834 [Lentinula edodes]